MALQVAPKWIRCKFTLLSFYNTANQFIKNKIIINSLSWGKEATNNYILK